MVIKYVGIEDDSYHDVQVTVLSRYLNDKIIRISCELSYTSFYFDLRWRQSVPLHWSLIGTNVNYDPSM